jgi:hypothetical protein
VQVVQGEQLEEFCEALKLPEEQAVQVRFTVADGVFDTKVPAAQFDQLVQLVTFVVVL